MTDVKKTPKKTPKRTLKSKSSSKKAKPPKEKSKDDVKNYHHGNLRHSLVMAACGLLRRNGADRLSLRAIAAEVGVSHMAPYSHFKNKKELVAAVIEYGFDQLADAMEQVARANTNNTPSLVLDYGATYLDFAINNPQLYRLMIGQVEAHGRQQAWPKNGSGSGPSSGSDAAFGTNPSEAPESEPSASTNAKDSPRPNISAKRPFVLLRDAFMHTLDDELKAKNQALGAWSLVHGLAALVIENRIRIPPEQSLKEFLAALSPRL